MFSGEVHLREYVDCSYVPYREIVTKIAVGIPEDWLRLMNEIAVPQETHFMKKLAVGTPEDPPRITLAGHSGGGSFIFGYVNGGDAIPDSIDRIVWLDAGPR